MLSLLLHVLKLIDLCKNSEIKGNRNKVTRLMTVASQGKILDFSTFHSVHVTKCLWHDDLCDYQII